LSAEEVYRKNRAGVVVVAQTYSCDHCDRTHCQIASGFMLTADGAFCTSYHVLSNRTAQAMIILTGDGRLAPVREVLAANRETDLVILRAEGLDFTPLPLSTNAPVGSLVRVISHPNNRFYSLTEGIVSRHFEHTHRRNSISMLAITADFAKGSSGAPVFNETGAVVASVNNTISSYYDSDEEGHKENLQMVFKSCVSSRHILDLIAPK
jgi:S1-C subfamily serine protease